MSDIWKIRAKRAKWALSKRIILESIASIKDPHRTFKPVRDTIMELEVVRSKIAILQLELTEELK